MKKKKFGLQQFFILTAIIMFLLVIIVPLWSAFSVSFMSNMESLNPENVLWPSNWTLEGYEALFTNVDLLTPLINTFVYIGIGTFIHMIVVSMAAYALVQKDLPGQRGITIFFMIAMLIPFEAIMIPRFMMMQEMGLIDHIASLILLTMASGFSILLLENYFKSVPDSLAESARIDGASEFKIFYKIYIPLAKNGFLIVMLFDIVTRWNEYGNAILYITSTDKYLIQQAIKQIVSPSGGGGNGDFMIYPNMQMASIVITTIPILILYLVFNRQFKAGVSLGGVKE